MFTKSSLHTHAWFDWKGVLSNFYVQESVIYFYFKLIADNLTTRTMKRKREPDTYSDVNYKFRILPVTTQVIQVSYTIFYLLITNLDKGKM